MELIGRPTIHPAVFYSGKICGYWIWLVYILHLFAVDVIEPSANDIRGPISTILSGLSLLLIFFSSVSLGRSVRLGLPQGETRLKTNGLYRFSRNPMYVGFHLITIAAMLQTTNAFVIIPGMYSLVVYHFIILGEETFLRKQLGEKYMNYQEKVRRYL